MIERYFIDQPSTLQQFHHLDGKRVLADLDNGDNEKVCRCYFLSGDVISQNITKLALSKGGW